MFLLDAAYLIVFIVISPWLVFMLLRKPAFRAGFKARFVPDANIGATARTIWLHGSSAGEVGLLCPLVTKIEVLEPDVRIVVSAFAISGYTAARRLFPQHTVIYFPVDLSPVIRRFLKVINPFVVVLVEAEIWPNFIAVATRAGVPVCTVNARMSDKSFNVHRRLALIPRALRKLSFMAVQSEEDADRFRRLGVDDARLQVTGNMKYDLIDVDNLGELAAARPALRQRFGVDEDMPVVIAASIHRDEDEAVALAYRKLIESGCRLRMVLVPRYPADAADMKLVLGRHALAGLQKTELDQQPDQALRGSSTVLIVDTMGELKQFYAMSDIAYVGGSLHFRASNKGGHNLMEPAVLGLAVMFGPHNYSFRETARHLVESDAGVQVRDEDQLYSQLKRLLDDPGSAHDMGDRARQVILDSRGATNKNFELLKTHMS